MPNHKKPEPCPQDKNHLCLTIYGSPECRTCEKVEKAFEECQESQGVTQCDQCPSFEDCCDYGDGVEEEAHEIYAQEQESQK